MVSDFHKQDKGPSWDHLKANRPDKWKKSLKQMVDEYEAQVLRLALGQSEGNIRDAAHILSINRTSLIEKLKKYGIKRKEFIPLKDLK